MPAPQLEALLRDLRRTKAILTPEELAHRLPRTAATGLPALDALLGGGLPEGKLVAVNGPAGAAATALSLSVLATCTATGGLAAVIDRASAFDPASARDAGVELERLLWCRPASAKEAVKAADVLLASGAFAVVVLDLRAAAAPAGGADPGRRRPEADPPGAAWLRLARDVEAARARLLVLGGGGAGSFAAASLTLGKPRARFAGHGPGRTFEGLEVGVSLAHNRLGLAPGEARLAFRAPDHFPGAAAGSASGLPSSRGPRGAREEGGDPWVLPPARPAANEDGAGLHELPPVLALEDAGETPAAIGADAGEGLLGVSAANAPGERPGVLTADARGERPDVSAADAAGERPGVLSADARGERPGVLSADARGERPGVFAADAAGERPGVPAAAAPGEREPAGQLGLPLLTVVRR